MCIVQFCYLHSIVFRSADLAWLAGMAADDGPASTIPAAGCDVFNIPVDRFMILYGAMSLGAWRKRCVSSVCFACVYARTL